MDLKHHIRRRIRKARKLGLYILQKTTSYRFDSALEANLAASTLRILSGQCPASLSRKIRSLADFDFRDPARYKIYLPDTAKTFVASPDGPETDDFGRRGKWKSRGVQIYEDLAEDRLIKTFPPRFAALGDGRFIEEALATGFYDHLCPLLEFLIHDTHGQLVGYCIKKGRQVTDFEFERYVDVILRPLICEAATRSGFYFYDLVAHNVIVRDGAISLIDIESILPVEWFGKPSSYAAGKLDIIDVGWPIQAKWKAPEWYASHIRDTQAERERKAGTAAYC